MRHALLAFPFLSLLACGGGQPPPSERVSPEQLQRTQQELAFLQCPPGVPATLAPPADQRLMLKLRGEGAQIYECKASATGAFAWTLKAPAADLTFLGFKLGTHYAGPTWELIDGSSVVGARVASAPSPDPTAIPWLLLSATSHGATQGLFTYVTSIQRLSTVGGLAPATGCDAAAAGALVEVPYEADYFFYRQGSPSGPNPHCG